MHRARRNRKSAAIRHLVQETHLHPSHLISPQFVIEGNGLHQKIESMPGIYRLSIDLLLREIEELLFLKIPAIALFPSLPSVIKSPLGEEALNPEGLIPRTIATIKKEFPEICVIADVALDPYTSHGHDGVVNERGEVLNDPTVEILVKMAQILAQAGADMVAPSDMMDGRIETIRTGLDEIGCQECSILSYSIKYASSLYAPFREAASSKLLFGDKKSYQLNPANHREALREAIIDIEEGADILMVKPALLYLDVLTKLREVTNLPIAAFQVSGEYAMIMAAAQNGWLDETNTLLESLLSIKRAGADMIFTYAAKKIAKILT